MARTGYAGAIGKRVPGRRMLCHSEVVDALLGAIIGLLVAAVLAMLNSWLTDREKVAESVREQRVRTYPSVWERTSVVSRWPRTDATREHAVHLHLDLRRWYYSGGGLFLSRAARERYEHLQVMLEAIVAQGDDGPLGHYEELMDAASWFRTGLTSDLQTRQSRNPLTAWSERRRLEQEGAEAREREHRVGAREYAGDGRTERHRPEHGPQVMLTVEDERLHLPDMGPSAGQGPG